jgi:hypothetical protein
MSLLGWLGKATVSDLPPAKTIQTEPPSDAVSYDLSDPPPAKTIRVETTSDAISYDPHCSGRTIRVVDPRSLSPVRRPTPERTVLGVLGTRSSVRYADMETQVLAPILEAWGTPDELVLPSDGESSYVLQAWATRVGIPVRLVSADWARNGRKAGSLRDAVIQREATHFVLLQGPRSNTLMTLAGRLNRKKRPVVISERPGEVVKGLGE